MTWSTAIAQLRLALSDGATDKFGWRKKCLGITDGTNKSFKTFEIRRVTDLHTASTPYGVFVNDAQATVDSDDIATGQFSLHAAPQEGDRIEATYYHQWFTDAQLDSFLQLSVLYLGLGIDYTQTPDGLIPCVIQYACGEAYKELSVRYARMLSEQFMMEDLPKKATKEAIDSYRNISSMCKKDAESLMKNYYTRQGRSLQPLFSTIAGNVRDVKSDK